MSTSTRFESAARDALSTATIAALRAAAEAYAGDLLPDWPDADWLTSRRRELQDIQREVLVGLAAALQEGAPSEALVVLGRVLETDPLHEGAVRAQMAVLARLGRRSEALARYEQLVDDLLEAYGTDPDASTVRLFRGLLTGSPAQERHRKPPPALSDDDDQLPTSLTSFIGRERELGDIERLTGQARLVTLTGTGGSGKTRLAVEAARRVRSDYPDKVWFVDLTAVRESVLVVDAVAEALGSDLAVAADRTQALVHHLRHRRLLIVLDNCEHLVAACSRLVAAVLAGCPRVVVLATSREPLHAHGEYTFRVPSLALPPPGRHGELEVERLGRLPSIRLFVERAAQVRPGFVLDAFNLSAVVDLCRRLDGMPLALELAAARATVLEPAEIVDRLGDTLSLLGGGPQSITRHQTLRATLEWSHDLLTEPEQVLFRRLSVFAGSFTLEAVESVCAGHPLQGSRLFELLVALVDKSLVALERAATSTRYRLLETVRQFAGEKLDQAAEVGRLGAAHAVYFLTVAVAHNPERATGVVIERPKLLDREHDNLRAALRWSSAHDPATALRLAASLWRFWILRGHAVEGARWVERALAAAPAPTRPRAAALIGLTGLDSRQGRSDRHRALGAEAMSIVRRIGDPEEIAAAQIVEAMLAWSTFDLDEAEQLAADVRAGGMAHGRPEHSAAGSWLLGHCALSRENGPRAVDYLDTFLNELADSDPGTRPFLPVVTSSLQLVPVAGRLVPFFEETMLLGRRVGVRQAVGYGLSALGYAKRLSGEQDAAIASVADAVDRFADLGDDLARAQALHQIGCIHRDSGDYRAAAEALTLAGELRTGVGDRRGELLTEINLALLQAKAGDVELGLGNARRSLSGFEAAGDPVGIGATWTALGAIELLTGEARAAREMYRRAAERFEPWPRFAGWLHLVMAELSVELADARRAEREIAAAAVVFDTTHCLIADRRLAVLRDGDETA